MTSKEPMHSKPSFANGYKRKGTDGETRCHPDMWGRTPALSGPHSAGCKSYPGGQQQRPPNAASCTTAMRLRKPPVEVPTADLPPFTLPWRRATRDRGYHEREGLGSRLAHGRGLRWEPAQDVSWGGAMRS